MVEAGFTPKASIYKTLLILSPNYSTAEGWFKQMTEKGFSLDEVTYAALIKLSPDYPTAERWHNNLIEAGFSPIVSNISQLINLSPDLTIAINWFKQIQKLKIPLDEKISCMLAVKVKYFTDAQNLTKILENSSAHIGQSYYAALYARIAWSITAAELLEWHFQQKYVWIGALESAIKAFAKLGRLEDSLRIALAFPYFDSACKVFREHGDNAITYFLQKIEEGFEPENATYALGICYMENEKYSEALQMFELSLSFSITTKRKEDIKKRIEIVSERLRKTEGSKLHI
jgi:tetratricopeptide (TPR) repeat protein